MRVRIRSLEIDRDWSDEEIEEELAAVVAEVEKSCVVRSVQLIPGFIGRSALVVLSTVDGPGDHGWRDPAGPDPAATPREP